MLGSGPCRCRHEGRARRRQAAQVRRSAACGTAAGAAAADADRGDAHEDRDIRPADPRDVAARRRAESETGLLSLAFAPDYATRGRFYVYFNGHEGNHDVNVVEFQRSASDPNVADRDSYRLLLTIHKPWENHNAGMMEFGPDGYLYIAVGDGDGGVLNPPGAFAQTLDDLLGSILRIDPRPQPSGAPYGIPPDNPFVGVGGARPEIWAYGCGIPGDSTSTR
jgi:glucose/arabinose dehydrogenase